jgi:hypothetical protein
MSGCLPPSSRKREDGHASSPGVPSTFHAALPCSAIGVVEERENGSFEGTFEPFLLNRTLLPALW